MTGAVNRQILLASRPEGMPKPSDFRIVASPMPVPAAGEMLIQAHYLSADPLQRERMKAGSTYGAVMQVGDVVWGRLVGQVVQSRHPGFAIGDFVEGMLGWQEYAISNGSRERARYAPGISRVDPGLAPISTSLGVMGMPGVTAYFALLELGRPKPGETVVVSAAAGTVGSIAGQIARILGCRVIGLAGSAEKCRYVVDDLGFEACIDYRATADLSQAIRTACPDGIDVYFDNVGGVVRDTMLCHLRQGARIPLVGRISTMHQVPPPLCPDPQVALMHARACMQGFIVYDYEDRADEAHRAIAGWLRDGRLTYRETVSQGFETAPNAFIEMLGGGNIGKQLVRLVA